MNRLQFVVVISIACFLAGCGNTELDTARVQLEQHRKMVVELQTKLDSALSGLSKQAAQIDELTGELRSLAEERAKLQAELLKKSSEVKVIKAEFSPKPGAPSKIESLGALAVANFKIEQLSKKIDALTKELQSKDSELGQIKQTFADKESELEKLRILTGRLESESKEKESVLKSKLDSVINELAKRDQTEKQVKAELKEKGDLLTTFKNAITDATRVKAAVETENEKLKAELTQYSDRLAEFSNNMETLKAQLAQVNQDVAQYRNAYEQTVAAVTKYKVAFDQSGKEIERLRVESQNLRNELTAATSQIQIPRQAAAPPTEDSDVDKILQSFHGDEAKPESTSHLY
jgi:chromosome segregation ATPase